MLSILPVMLLALSDDECRLKTNDYGDVVISSACFALTC